MPQWQTDATIAESALGSAARWHCYRSARPLSQDFLASCERHATDMRPEALRHATLVRTPDAEISIPPPLSNPKIPPIDARLIVVRCLKKPYEVAGPPQATSSVEPSLAAGD